MPQAGKQHGAHGLGPPLVVRQPVGEQAQVDAEDAEAARGLNWGGARAWGAPSTAEGAGSRRDGARLAAAGLAVPQAGRQAAAAAEPLRRSARSGRSGVRPAPSSPAAGPGPSRPRNVARGPGRRERAAQGAGRGRAVGRRASGASRAGMAWRAGLLVASLSDDSLASSVRVDSFVRARELQGSHRGQGHVAQLVRGGGKALSPREPGGMGTGGATGEAARLLTRTEPRRRLENKRESERDPGPAPDPSRPALP